MKKLQVAQKFRVKALRGFIGEDQKPVAVDGIITCGRSLARVLQSTGRGEILPKSKTPAAGE